MDVEIGRHGLLNLRKQVVELRIAAAYVRPVVPLRGTLSLS
jgi:hypothetical protein